MTEGIDINIAGLLFEANHAATVAMVKFPQPNYVLLKVAEEAGEVVQEAVHFAEGRGTATAVRKEIVQTIAMLIRLYEEGDLVNGIPAIGPACVKEIASNDQS
jgi:hypothetical protein